MKKIHMTKTHYIKNPNTKTTYYIEDVEREEISEKEYNNITSTDTQRFFRRLGGSETAQRTYTSAGYLITKLTSISPDRKTKKVYQFKF
tara:strand:+ start:985 stop:1251 length:267 start_codon:yes stop_codon:yes gene_type:complete